MFRCLFVTVGLIGTTTATGVLGAALLWNKGYTTMEPEIRWSTLPPRFRWMAALCAGAVPEIAVVFVASLVRLGIATPP